MKIKNHILIGITIIAVIISGYFVYQNVQRLRTVDMRQTDLV